jgi:hypothetical protein
MIHAPLGLLSIGLALEILTLPWRRSSARVAGRWMLLIGSIMAVPAVTTGIYAYHDVINPSTNVGELDLSTHWNDLLDQTVKDRIPDATSSGDDRIRDIPVRQLLAGETGQLLKQHIIRNSIGLGLILLAVITFIGCSDRWRRTLYIPLLIVLLAGEGGVISGSHHGGLTVYQQGAMIKPLPAGKPTDVKPTKEELLESFLPPAQLHFTLAGWMVGFALFSIALSIRVMTHGTPVPRVDEQWMESHRTEPGSPVPGTPNHLDEGITERESLSFPPGPEAVTTQESLAGLPRGAALTPVMTVPVIPAARVWLLALLAGIATAAAGLWLFHMWDWHSFLSEVKGENRNMYHAILGVTIIVLTLLLTIFARFARHAKLLLGIFSFLLLAAIGLQIYVGVLMTFDSPQGPRGNLLKPLHWNTEKSKAAVTNPLPRVGAEG